MSAVSVTSSFTGTGTSAEILVPRGQQLTVSISGTFSATVALQQLIQGAWVTIQSFTAVGSATLTAENGVQQEAQCRYRLNCTSFTSGTAVSTINGMQDINDLLPVPYVAADYVAQAGTWQPTAAQVATLRYRILGKRMLVLFQVTAGTPSGTPTFLSIPIPGGFVAGSTVRTPFGFTNTAAGIGVVGVDAGGTVIKMFKDATETAAFANAVFTASFSFEFEIR